MERGVERSTARCSSEVTVVFAAARRHLGACRSTPVSPSPGPLPRRRHISSRHRLMTSTRQPFLNRSMSSARKGTDSLAATVPLSPLVWRFLPWRHSSWGWCPAADRATLHASARHRTRRVIDSIVLHRSSGSRRGNDRETIDTHR